MADRKISDLTALTTPATGDLIPIVDISEAAAADKNKSITVGELLRGAPDGTAAAPGIAFESDGGNGMFLGGTDILAFSTGGTQAVTIDASQRLGVGVASPGQLLHLSANGGTNIQANSRAFFGSQYSDHFAVIGSAVRVDTGQTTGMVSTETSSGNGAPSAIRFGAGAIQFHSAASGTAGAAFNSERARIDSSGRLLVGTSTEITPSTHAKLQAASTGGAYLVLARNDTSVLNNNIGVISFYGNDDNGTYEECAQIACVSEGAHATGDKPSYLSFQTTADGASSPTERMRITASGDVTTTNTSTFSRTNAGFTARNGDSVSITRANGTPLEINRQGNDGQIVTFYESNSAEGSITISGTTTSYNGAHLSRWSQLPGGVERTEILRGSVLSNIDEMCEWGEEENEQLNRMKVSDVEGDKNVSGVFQAWDDDDDTYTNDFYCAMTGDFVIRIAQGVTVERGDLLMSAGDGTAKPQEDDIIRSKTIAKVTSTNVSCTYDDGSYCVPCVLMAC